MNYYANPELTSAGETLGVPVLPAFPGHIQRPLLTFALRLLLDSLAVFRDLAVALDGGTSTPELFGHRQRHLCPDP